MERKSLQILSGFVLKVIGFITMTFDHVGMFLIMGNPNGSTAYTVGYVFKIVGRLAFPIFVLLCAEAVRKSHRPWKYFFRLLIMNLVIIAGESIYFYLTPNPQATPYEINGNAFADLTLIALTLILLKKKSWLSLLALLPFAFICFQYGVELYEKSHDAIARFLPNYVRTGYSLFGLLIGLGFYYAYPVADKLAKPMAAQISMPMESYRETSAYQRMVNIVGACFFFLILAVFYAVSYIGYNYNFRPYDTLYMPIQSYSILVIPFLIMYSGKRGYDSKPARWITYLYYPVHMLVIMAIFWL